MTKRWYGCFSQEVCNRLLTSLEHLDHEGFAARCIVRGKGIMPTRLSFIVNRPPLHGGQHESHGSLRCAASPKYGLMVHDAVLSRHNQPFGRRLNTQRGNVTVGDGACIRTSRIGRMSRKMSDMATSASVVPTAAWWAVRDSRLLFRVPKVA